MKKNSILATLMVAILACVAYLAPQAIPTVATVAGLGGVAYLFATQRPALMALGNTWVENLLTHHYAINRTADAALATKCLLVKFGSTPTTGVDVCGAANRPAGVTDESTYASGDNVTVLLLSSDMTRKMVASGAITAGGAVYTDAGGKVQATPTTAGVYYRVGVALTTTASDGQFLEVMTHAPQRVRVLALPGNVNSEISGLTIGGTYSQSEVQALRAACEELADDFRALAAETTEPTAFVWLAA